MVLSRAPNHPKWWFCYVDDSHVCVNSRHVVEFHSHINSINSHIKFIIQIESEGPTAFLGTKTTRQEDGSLSPSLSTEKLLPPTVITPPSPAWTLGRTHPHGSLKEHPFNQGGSITGNWTSSQSPSLVIQPRSQVTRMLVIFPYAKGFPERGACGKLPWFWSIGARNSTWSTVVYI